jgi:hypothetical protein
VEKQANSGFLLFEALVALALITLFLASSGVLFRASWSLFLGGRRRIVALGRVIEAVECGGRGEIRGLSGRLSGVVRGERGLPDCRYRLVEVDGVWVCARV